MPTASPLDMLAGVRTQLDQNCCPRVQFVFKILEVPYLKSMIYVNNIIVRLHI